MSVIKVGTLLVPGKTQWPEAFEYNFDRNGHRLRYFLRSPTRGEVKSLKRGPIQLRLQLIGDIPVMLAQSGAIPWCDCPYNYWALAPERRIAPESIGPGEGVLMTILLTDADTGILQVIRAVSLPTDFSQALHRAIAGQIAGGQSPDGPVPEAYQPQAFARRVATVQRQSAQALAEAAPFRYASPKTGPKKGFGVP